MTEEHFLNDYIGFISTEHTVWCGGCRLWISKSSNTKADMKRIITKNGWYFSKKYGWLCEKCKNKFVI